MVLKLVWSNFIGNNVVVFLPTGEKKTPASLETVKNSIERITVIHSIIVIYSARREGLDGRDRGDSGCPGEDGGGRDMEAC